MEFSFCGLYRSVVTQSPVPSVITIGNFDGIHVGHQQLLDCLAAESLRRVLVTFDPQPPVFSVPASCPFISVARKMDKITGVAHRSVYLMSF